MLRKSISHDRIAATLPDMRRRIGKSAHDKFVTHRDIKSSNIMITESGQIKIMDFGLANRPRGAVDEGSFHPRHDGVNGFQSRVEFTSFL